MTFFNGGHSLFHTSCCGEFINGKGSFSFHWMALSALPGTWANMGQVMDFYHPATGGGGSTAGIRRHRAEDTGTLHQRQILTQIITPPSRFAQQQEEERVPIPSPLESLESPGWKNPWSSVYSLCSNYCLTQHYPDFQHKFTGNSRMSKWLQVENDLPGPAAEVRQPDKKGVLLFLFHGALRHWKRSS